MAQRPTPTVETPMRVVVAMSGGVDSSVAAALLAEAGHEVIGLSMQLYDQREGEAGYGSCCSLDDLHDAGRVARRLNIPHYIVNFEREFQRTVVANLRSLLHCAQGSGVRPAAYSLTKFAITCWSNCFSKWTM